MPGIYRPRQKKRKQLATGLILGRTCPENTRQIGFARSADVAPQAELITYSGDGHIITIAPTGTGKTAGPVICNALSHPGQLIVLDVKGEVHRVTARRRGEMGQRVHVLDLRDGKGKSDSLNPLDLAVRCGTEPAAVARASPPNSSSAVRRDRFWSDWAETMITAGIAWLLEDCPPEKRQLSTFFDLLTEGDADFSNCPSGRRAPLCSEAPLLRCGFSTASLRAA
jgi:type IV secretion system protein VirD4